MAQMTGHLRPAYMRRFASLAAHAAENHDIVAGRSVDADLRNADNVQRRAMRPRELTHQQRDSTRKRREPAACRGRIGHAHR
ncbi:MAG: hypothetical protein JJU09_02260 [Rhodobacteraceae bacterium]|nr:hypothetical protein [Paracoccaceae bacterium]